MGSIVEKVSSHNRGNYEVTEELFKDDDIKHISTDTAHVSWKTWHDVQWIISNANLISQPSKKLSNYTVQFCAYQEF